MRTQMMFVLVTLAALLAEPLHAAAAIDQIHTVGIISAIGDTIELKHIGISIVGNSTELVDIANWNLDGAIQQNVAAALSGRFAIKTVTADPKPLYVRHTAVVIPAEAPDVEAYVQSLPATNNVDAYIIVEKQILEDPVDDSNQWLWGLGLYDHQKVLGAKDSIFGMFSSSQETIGSSSRDANATALGAPGSDAAPIKAYSFYKVLLVEAKTGHILRSGVAQLSRPRGFGIDWPITTALDLFPPLQAKQLSETQLRAVKASMKDLIERSLPMALQDAGLIDGAFNRH